jgi:hypothetical protein
MSWKKPKKINNSKHCFYHTYINVLFTPVGTFVKVQLNRLLAFSPKTIIVSEQKKLSHQWQLIDAAGSCVSLEQYKEN